LQGANLVDEVLLQLGGIHRDGTSTKCVPASLVDPFRRPILTPTKSQNLQ